MNALLADLHYALRQLRKAPMFSGVAIATLAIGIGATTAIFSTVNATLLRPLPFAQPDRLLDIRTRLVDGRVTTGMLSSVEIAALRALPSVAESVGAYSNQTFNATYVQDGGALVDVLITAVDRGFFNVFGMPPAIGRGFTGPEYSATDRDAPYALVVSDRAWTHFFGRDPGVVGRTIRIAEFGNNTMTIVGVAPPALDFPLGTDFWL